MKFIPGHFKKKLRRYKRKAKKVYSPKLDLAGFRRILTDTLQISKGDTVLVHTSFGNLYPGFSPLQGIECLVDIIGDEGNILMPNYPPGKSYQWIKEKNIFDVRNNPVGTGILARTFGNYKGVKKSIHPIKSLAVWGKDRDYLISEHHLSVTPYDQKSPYYKMMELKNPKSIGLGTLSNSFIHCCEDNIDEHPKTMYNNELFEIECINENGEPITVNTHAHDPAVVEASISSSKFLKKYNCPYLNEHYISNTYYFDCSVKDIYKFVRDIAIRGIFRITTHEN